MSRPLVLACGALAGELRAVLAADSLTEAIEVRYLPANLHNRPEHIVPTRVLSASANKLRRAPRLIAHLTQAGCLHEDRIGNTRLTWIRAKDLAHGAEALAQSGAHFFDRSSPTAPVIN